MMVGEYKPRSVCFNFTASDKKRKWKERQKLRRKRFLAKKKKLNNEPVQISDIDSSEVGMMEQEVISLDHSDEGGSQPPFRVRKTEELISSSLGVPNASGTVVLIISDSEDSESQNPLKPSSLELDTGPAEKPEIPFRIKSTQELVEDVRWSPPGYNARVSSHGPGAPSGETSSSGDSRYDQNNVEKHGIPFRIRTTAELVGGSGSLHTHVESGGGASQTLPSSGSKPALSLSVTERGLSPAASHSSDQSQDGPKSQDPAASGDGNVTNHLAAPPGKDKSGIPFRIRSTTELVEQTAVRPCGVPNLVCTSGETLPSSSDQSTVGKCMPFRIRSTTELMGDASNVHGRASSSALPDVVQSDVQRSDSIRRQPIAEVLKVCNSLVYTQSSNFLRHNDPPQPTLNSQTKMDIEDKFGSISSCDASEMPASSKTVFSAMRDDVAGMQPCRKSPLYSNTDRASELPSTTEATFPTPPSYFYTESPTPRTGWSRIGSNHQRRIPENRREMLQQYPKPVPPEHQTFSPAAILDVTSVAVALGAGPWNPLGVPAKRKRGRSERECEILDQYNQVSAELGELKLLKKTLEKQPVHALNILPGHCPNVFRVESSKVLREHRWQLARVQRELLTELKAERKRVGSIKEKRLEKLKSKRSQACTTLLRSIATSLGESSVIQVNLDGESEDDQTPPEHSIATSSVERSVVYVNLDGELEDDQAPPEPAPKSRAVDSDHPVIGGGRHGECRLPSPMPVDDQDDGTAPRDSKVCTGSSLIGMTGAASWTDVGAPKTPFSDVDTSPSDVEIRCGASEVSDRGSGFGDQDAVAPQGSVQAPRGSPLDCSEPSPSTESSGPSKTLIPTPISDVKTENSDRNVAPPKLPWTALSDTSWDALYR